MQGVVVRGGAGHGAPTDPSQLGVVAAERKPVRPHAQASPRGGPPLRGHGLRARCIRP